jgi:hypothetical protein
MIKKKPAPKKQDSSLDKNSPLYKKLSQQIVDDEQKRLKRLAAAMTFARKLRF